MPRKHIDLTGYWSRVALSLVWFPAEGDPALLVPETEIDVAETVGCVTYRVTLVN